jgi:hypothetical protein
VVKVSDQQYVKASSARTYENPQFGMKIPYPSDWSVDTSLFNPNAKLPTVIFNPPPGQDEHLFMKAKYQPFIWVHVARGITSSPQNYAQEEMKMIQDEHAIIKEKGPAIINGKEAYSFTYVFENTPASGTIKDVYLAIKSDYNTIYIFELQAVPINKFNQYVFILKVMAEMAQLKGVQSSSVNQLPASNTGRQQQTPTSYYLANKDI